MNDTSTPAIGVDIGGTKVLAGVVDESGEVLGSVRLQTPHRSMAPDVVEATIIEAVTQLRTSHEVGAVGVGAAGFVDAAGERVAFSPHLSWRDEPLKKALEVRLGLPVLVDNDANTTAWAELRFGAARDHRHVLCVTLGTGIGGALILDGSVYRGGHGMAGEFGHMQVVPQGRFCECGNRGCWEQYSSGNALVREARELVTARSPAAVRLRELVDGDPDRLTGAVVTQAAQAGEQAAIEVFREVGSWLGLGLAGLCAGFDPELVVIGGGVSEAGDLLLDPARESLAHALVGRGFRPLPPVVRAELGADAGFIGAADLARTAE
ncbi:MAG TPA: ROK family glucokinase [Nocardioidaceae bacterium]|nr:ROK family glucokinase [Nocardioidaceae bacterium]